MVVQTERNSAVGAQRLLRPSALFSYAQISAVYPFVYTKISTLVGLFGKFTRSACKHTRLTGRDSSEPLNIRRSNHLARQGARSVNTVNGCLQGVFTARKAKFRNSCA